MEKVKKPHLIYTLPRAKSTAILQASKKKINLNEPFSYEFLFGHINYQDIFFDNYWEVTIQEKKWNLIKSSMNNPDSVVKVLGFDVENLSQGKKWLEDALKKQTHEVFVVHRDLKEVCWSYLLATRRGFFHNDNASNKPFSLKLIDLVFLEKHIKDYLRHLPQKNAKLISWDRLPKKYFDKSRVRITEQFSSKHLHLIENFDFCKNKIEEFKEIYQPIIDKRVLTLPWAE